MEPHIPGQWQGVSAALAGAQASATVAATVHFPSKDGGVSLADMAQRDLDAALQLLADRAQYITGASGAAIALRRDGRDDMLCRASVGSNAPELGALLSTEFGLSGESVRTRRLMRCDDAERDVRVNREVCRQMGIASVLVMPVVNDDQVLGVFELFSGRANAFGERDLSAVQRLSKMVETAVRLADATEHPPEQLSERESSVAEAVHPEVFEGQFLGDLAVEEEVLEEEAKEEDEEEVQPPPEPRSVETIASALEPPVTPAVPSVAEIGPKANSRELQEESALPPVPALSLPANLPRPENKPLLWSDAAAGEGEAVRSATAQRQAPPVLRGLRRCEVCGFPISAGRILCVQCEEKKWREQLWPPDSARKPPAGVSPAPDARATGLSFTAAAASMAKAQDPGDIVWEPGRASTRFDLPAANSGSVPADELTGAMFPAPSDRLEPILSGLEPSQSWFSANRYVLLALLAIGIAVMVFLLLR